jgi:2-keto-4-pentenoate hydratase
LRRRRLEAGERPIGWKVGFGSAAAMERLGTEAPLVGFLTDRSLVASGSEVSIERWTAPVLEPEIAIHVGDDGGVAAVSAAIELADVHPPAADPEAILAGNVYHRSLILGTRRAPAADGLRARVHRGGALAASTDDVQELTGPVAQVLRLVRGVVGDRLRPGDVVIAGSIVPPLPVGPGGEARYELDPLETLSVSFAAISSSVSS